VLATFSRDGQSQLPAGLRGSERNKEIFVVEGFFPSAKAYCSQLKTLKEWKTTEFDTCQHEAINDNNVGRITMSTLQILPTSLPWHRHHISNSKRLLLVAH